MCVSLVMLYNFYYDGLIASRVMGRRAFCSEDQLQSFLVKTCPSVHFRLV